jgi:hypothetical protein
VKIVYSQSRCRSGLNSPPWPPFDSNRVRNCAYNSQVSMTFRPRKKGVQISICDVRVQMERRKTYKKNKKSVRRLLNSFKNTERHDYNGEHKYLSTSATDHIE